MLKKVLVAFFVVFSLSLLFYVSLPNFDFPKPPFGSVQSNEPADTETPLRRAYFTNYTRQQVLDWYEAQFKYSTFHNIPLPTYLLNYPPENSQSIIRDQTRSTFLQEIVHPFRETVFINGYEPAPTDYENRIVIDGTHWRQKIIIKYIPSSLILRLLITLTTLASIPVIYLAFVPEISFLKRMLKSRKMKTT
jgi:hypothetical protein